MEQDDLAVDLLGEMYDILQEMRYGKGNAESADKGRAWAIAVTEMEKIAGYFALNVVPAKQLVEFLKMRGELSNGTKASR